MLPGFRKLLANLADICFPPRCLSCQTGIAAGDPLFFCAACRADISLLTGALCHRCGAPFPLATESHYCGNCLKGRNSFDLARSVAVYEGAVRDAVHALKYGRYTAGINAFGMLFREAITDPTILNPELIIPVPLHVRRLRQRGFNQSVILARQFFPDLRGKIKPRALVRQVHTAPQTSLSRHQRLANIKGAFRVPHPEVIKGRSVVLVDDIYTTGATLNECARTLRRAGASQVFGLTFARVMDH